MVADADPWQDDGGAAYPDIPADGDRGGKRFFPLIHGMEIGVVNAGEVGDDGVVTDFDAIGGSYGNSLVDEDLAAEEKRACADGGDFGTELLAAKDAPAANAKDSFRGGL